MGQFKKDDDRINKGGRPVGSKNKASEAIRKQLQDFLEVNLSTLQKDFDCLKPAERLAFVEKLCRHVLPRPLHPLETLTDAQLDMIIQQLKRGEL